MDDFGSMISIIGGAGVRLSRGVTQVCVSEVTQLMVEFRQGPRMALRGRCCSGQLSPFRAAQGRAPAKERLRRGQSSISPLTMPDEASHLKGRARPLPAPVRKGWRTSKARLGSKRVTFDQSIWLVTGARCLNGTESDTHLGAVRLFKSFPCSILVRV